MALMNNQAGKVDAYQWRQFGLAGVTPTKGVWNFDDTQTSEPERDHVDQDLETVR